MFLTCVRAHLSSTWLVNITSSNKTRLQTSLSFYARTFTQLFSVSLAKDHILNSKARAWVTKAINIHVIFYTNSCLKCHDFWSTKGTDALEANYHLFNAQIKVSESSDEGFLCGESSERQAATALAASELDMATSDRCPSWRLNKL